VATLARVAALRPDVVSVAAEFRAGAGPAVGLRFPPTQFVREGVIWQHVLVRPAVRFEAPPSTGDLATAEVRLRSSVVPFDALEATSPEERAQGLRRFHVPVALLEAAPEPLRHAGQPDPRPEPSREITHHLELEVGEEAAAATAGLPVYEALGRLAPRREYAMAAWPGAEALRAVLPDPILPADLAHLRPLHDEAWAMLLRLARRGDAASGLPGDFVSTGSGFTHFQFVWDTCFAALCTAYGHRAFPVHASLDVLYSRQFDGGYIHRQHDVRDGSPVLFEPDFSPNPPLMAVAELAIARLTGDRLRLHRVYTALVVQQRWMQANRRLADGTYWTTGLASGLDNSPNLGEAYPDLTAQMVHDAEALSEIAAALGRAEEAADWSDERLRTAEALNARCWDDRAGIYATGLEEGGHNPHKTIAGFWPLWAGAAPAERAEALARHAENPATFGRHHPLPSVAADSPRFNPGGKYWLGSIWPPTNYVAISGLDRAGHHALARRLALRHLERMNAVFRATGRIWENYSSEADQPGSWSGQDYGWSALGPIALLFEVVLGLKADALSGVLEWRPPPGDFSGVRRFPLGQATVSLSRRAFGGGAIVEAATDRPITLRLLVGTQVIERALRPGVSQVGLPGQA
jgi:hypothetical protein